MRAVQSNTHRLHCQLEPSTSQRKNIVYTSTSSSVRRQEIEKSALPDQFVVLHPESTCIASPPINFKALTTAQKRRTATSNRGSIVYSYWIQYASITKHCSAFCSFSYWVLFTFISGCRQVELLACLSSLYIF